MLPIKKELGGQLFKQNEIAIPSIKILNENIPVFIYLFITNSMNFPSYFHRLRTGWNQIILCLILINLYCTHDPGVLQSSYVHIVY